MTSEKSSPVDIARGVARKAGVNRAALRDMGLRAQQVFKDEVIAINDAFSDVRLVLDVSSGDWLLYVYATYFLVEEPDISRLGSILPMELSVGAIEIEGPCNVEVDRDSLIVVGRGRSAETRVMLDCSDLNVVAPISITPQCHADGWVPTSFRLRAEHLHRIELQTYVPEVDGLGPKEYVVSAAGEVVAVGQMERGSPSSIVIEHRCDPAGTVFDISLAYPELSTPSELRSLGAIVTGVSRVLPKKALRA